MSRCPDDDKQDDDNDEDDAENDDDEDDDDDNDADDDDDDDEDEDDDDDHNDELGPPKIVDFLPRSTSTHFTAKNRPRSRPRGGLLIGPPFGRLGPWTPLQGSLDGSLLFFTCKLQGPANSTK